MKILFISNLFPPDSIGGYEENCSDVATTLASAGHTIWVLTAEGRGEADVADGPRVLRWMRLQRGLAGSPARRSALARTIPVVDWVNVRAVKRALAAMEPDAVVVWNGEGLGRAFLTASPGVVRRLPGRWLAAPPAGAP